MACRNLHKVEPWDSFGAILQLLEDSLGPLKAKELDEILALRAEAPTSAAAPAQMATEDLEELMDGKDQQA
eukprot:7245257-Lingulodinium_polyedra.AAC.1